MVWLYAPTDRYDQLSTQLQHLADRLHELRSEMDRARDAGDARGMAQLQQQLQIMTDKHAELLREQQEQTGFIRAR